jgi:hypothetical protein
MSDYRDVDWPTLVENLECLLMQITTVEGQCQAKGLQMAATDLRRATVNVRNAASAVSEFRMHVINRRLGVL